MNITSPFEAVGTDCCSPASGLLGVCYRHYSLDIERAIQLKQPCCACCRIFFPPSIVETWLC